MSTRHTQPSTACDGQCHSLEVTFSYRCTFTLQHGPVVDFAGSEYEALLDKTARGQDLFEDSFCNIRQLWGGNLLLSEQLAGAKHIQQEKRRKAANLAIDAAT